ncbi:MAG: PspC domain-containing protein [Vicinamibacterales bacterium]
MDSTTGTTASSTASGPRRLVRITADERVAGVCAGIADYLDVDVTLVRALWLALSIVPGAVIGGIVAYVLAWIVMPEGQANRVSLGRRLVRSVGDAKVAGVCGGLADYFGVDSTLVRVAWIVLSVMPGAIVGGLLVYLAAWFIVPKAPTAIPHQQPQAA